jgi:hypothetical protein
MNRTWKPLLLWTTVVMLLTGLSGADGVDSFVPDDQIVSDPTVDLVNPEFDSLWNRLVWQDKAGKLWVADLDESTGALIPPDGRGRLVDSGLYPAQLSGNGPEWVYGNNTIFIAYTKSVNGVPSLGAAQINARGEWIPKVLQIGDHRWRPFGSPASNAGEPRILYVRRSPSGQKMLAWRKLGNPITEKTLPIMPAGGRWIEDEPAFVTAYSIDGISQVVRVDADTGQVSQITADTDNKIAPFMWLAPDHQDYVLLSQLGTTKVAIYRRINREWTRVYEISLPTDKPYVSSPQPFISGGRSYISVVAAESLQSVGALTLHPIGPSEIWLAGIDPAAPFFRRVDDPSTEANRTSPSVYYTTSGPVIFYNQLDDSTGRTLLRRAATGLPL